jgi:hypothetical protein
VEQVVPEPEEGHCEKPDADLGGKAQSFLLLEAQSGGHVIRQGRGSKCANERHRSGEIDHHEFLTAFASMVMAPALGIVPEACVPFGSRWTGPSPADP